jgi:hypothetical protein
MTWSGILKVVDCATNQPIPLTIVVSDSAPVVGSTGEFIATIDDQFERFTVMVEAPGYSLGTFTFVRDPKSGGGGTHTICLGKEQPAPPPPPPPKVLPPSQLRSRVEEGQFTVSWVCDDCDNFNVTIIPSVVPFQGQLELAGTDRSFTQTRTPGNVTYQFSIQRCKKGFLDFSSNCSEWVSIEVFVPSELGFKPWRPWFRLPGQAVFDRDKQQIAAVSRAPGNLDLFVIGFDNHVWTTFWNDAGGWNGDWFPVPGQAVFDRDKQQIAAVSRAPGNLDLFVIGFDNHVWTTFWNDAGGWNGDWFPIPGQAVFDRDKQQIAAVSRAPDNLDLFVIGFDNHIWSARWSP